MQVRRGRSRRSPRRSNRRTRPRPPLHRRSRPGSTPPLRIRRGSPSWPGREARAPAATRPPHPDPTTATRDDTMNGMHRIGLIVPSSNTTMETEVPSLLRERERERPQDTFTFHSARVRMEHVTREALRAMNAETERATTELADMRPHVVASACLVAIMAQGPKHHCVVEAEIESILERAQATAPAVSSAGALVDAL